MVTSCIRLSFIIIVIYSAIAACSQEKVAVVEDNTPIVDLLTDSFVLNIESSDILISQEPESGIEIHHNNIKLVDTSLIIELRFSTDVSAGVSCTFQKNAITANGSGYYRYRFSPAYLEELIEIRCLHRGVEVYYINFKLFASDEQIDKELAIYFKYLPKYELNNFNATETDLRRVNFYYEMHNLISASQIYMSPQSFALNESSEEYILIENYLINLAETFFQPCAGYDFYNGPMSHCRSEERVGKYYLWRSPQNNEPVWRVSHPKVDWRAAGGISVAIQALLLKNNVESEICEVSNLPSEVRDQSISCRAKNIRRMIYNEIWVKWSDSGYVSNTLNLPAVATIQGTDVAHYVAWIELIVDMFQNTKEIKLVGNCSTEIKCNIPVIQSKLDYLLKFVEQGEYVTFKCKLGNASCFWHEYNFAQSGSNDISHLAIFLYVLENKAAISGSEDVCNSDNSKCIRMTSLINTIKDRTWVEYAPNIAGAINFPKFDVFFNGYCSKASVNASSPMYDFCLEHWAKETIHSNAHLQLFGIASLGKYDRELMIMLRRAADVNKDGILTGEDVLMRDYLIPLSNSLNKPTKF